jgi:putative membrane protein
MRGIGLLWLTAAVFVSVVGCSNTESKQPPTRDEAGAPAGAVGTGGAGANVRSDDDFVNDVAIKNMAEIELSRIALNKAISPDVKSFAQMMVDDHGAAANTLKTAVATEPIEWPAQLDDKRKKAAEELANTQGADFDYEYAKTMVESHQDLAAKLEARLDLASVEEWKTTAAGSTQNRALPEPRAAMRDVSVRPGRSDNALTMKINQWAADTYPVAQKHLDTARMLEKATKKRSTN